MDNPSIEGEFEPLGTLASTLQPIFTREVGSRFLAWSDANAKAWDAKQEQTELQMEGRWYNQKTLKYPARGLASLRSKFEQVSDDPELRGILDASGCLPYLSQTT